MKYLKLLALTLTAAALVAQPSRPRPETGAAGLEKAVVKPG